MRNLPVFWRLSPNSFISSGSNTPKLIAKPRFNAWHTKEQTLMNHEKKLSDRCFGPLHVFDILLLCFKNRKFKDKNSPLRNFLLKFYRTALLPRFWKMKISCAVGKGPEEELTLVVIVWPIWLCNYSQWLNILSQVSFIRIVFSWLPINSPTPFLKEIVTLLFSEDSQ